MLSGGKVVAPYLRGCGKNKKGRADVTSLFVIERNLETVTSLENKLRNFYECTDSYSVFKQVTWKPWFWAAVLEQLGRIENGSGRILEIGAAKSGFGKYLEQSGTHCHVAFHDITSRCREHLSQYSRELYFGPIDDIRSEKFDVVFHSYVFEHVTRPRHFLDTVGRLLTQNGVHIIESPRYDLPIYIPPAIRHNDKLTILNYVLGSLSDIYPDFSIVKNPAIFSRKYRRDYDAVHRVTLRAIKRYAKENKWEVSEFKQRENDRPANLIENQTRLRVILKKSEATRRSGLLSVGKRKLKISIVLGPFLSIPPNPTGAVERRWSDVAEQFSQKGHEVTLIGKRLKTRTSGVRYISDRGENRCGSLWKNIFLDMRYANRVARRIGESDIVITNSFSLPVILSQQKRLGAKYKIVVNLARIPKGQLFLYRNADRIVVVSTAVLDAVEEQDDTAFRKSVMIPNPIDCRIFNSEKREASPLRKRQLLYAGRIAREKGVEILIDAFRALPKNSSFEYTLKIVGPYRIEEGGDGELYYQELKKRAGNARVEFLEPVWDRTKLATLYRQADIFVYPSIDENGETFGIAPLEAMACGAVTVLSELKCFSQFARDGENSLVARMADRENSAENIRSRIIELENESIYISLQKAGIETAKKFDTEIIADLYLREIEKMNMN